MSAAPKRARVAVLLPVLALAAGFAAAVVALRPRDGDPAPGAAPTTRGLTAEGFVDAVGVNVHLSYTDTAYVHAGALVARLRELGVRHVRDAMPLPGEPLAAGLRLAAERGIRATLLTRDLARAPRHAVADAVRVLGRDVDAFEGPNELDNSGDPRWPATLTAYMPVLRHAVRRQAPGITVVGPSLARPEAREQLPEDLPGVTNVHPYAGGRAPEDEQRAALDRLTPAQARRGIVFTEVGYHDALPWPGWQPPVSPEAASTYLPRALLAAYAAGVRRTFVYELVDEKPDPGLTDPEQHFGLLRNDLSPKPAFTALRTLIRVVRSSPGRARERALRWRLDGPRGTEVERVELPRSDGSLLVALWRPVSVWDVEAKTATPVPDARARLHVPAGARDVAVWRPSRSTRPVLERAATTEIPLELGPDVTLVSLR